MEIRYNEEMSKHTSFKTGGKADFFLVAKGQEEVEEAIKFTNEKNIPLYILGNGSNLLVKDKGIRGAVLKIELEDMELSEEQENVIVTVGAGKKTMLLAIELKQKGVTGFEEFSGIPGTIGGANRMNAGAFGKELKDIIVETKCIDREGKKFILKKDEQELAYRKSIFKNNEYIILNTKLALKKGNTKDIEEKMKQYAIWRKENQPIEFPSAGSTFKRGKNYISAKLIDECGLKGYSIGGAQISEKHAGFIINKGNATSKDILDLIEFTKRRVFEKFKVKLEEEVEIIGE